MVQTKIPKAIPGNYDSIAAQYSRAIAIREAEEAAKQAAKAGKLGKGGKETPLEKLNAWKRARFGREWVWVMAAFIWLLFIHASGLYFFTRGFLLTRLVLEDKSSCSDPPIDIISHYSGSGTIGAGCWHPKTFDKAVVVIIDALRYDFTVPSADSEPFHNALPFLYETAVSHPENAFLLPFIADPPTATMQRLKGLTTGTLPTFIDVGANFAGTAIEEDNLLAQMRGLGRKIVHLGDDTWTALFPGYFEANISRAYDSFNVWDLHTVDNGVVEHIMPLTSQERKDEWDVMFAHFLGVDHAGHRYGPNHPAMTAKLQQMDGVLRNLTANLDDNTLLVVMGDHGMDGKGDHGGESDDEIEAALWMYSKKGIFGRTDSEFVTPPSTAKIRPVNQIDLVPTLALLLGLPIPFNNLGKPIEEAFAGKNGNAWDNLAAVARMTSAGIKRYQAAYNEGVDEGSLDGSPLALWATAEAINAGQGKNKMMKESYLAFSAFQAETLRLCRSLWANFDVSSMILGVGILAAGVIALLLFANWNFEEDFSSVEDPELDRTESQLELESFEKGTLSLDDETSAKSFVRGALLGSLLGATAAPAIWVATGGMGSIVDFSIAVGSIGSLVGVFYQELRRRMAFNSPFPSTYWGWLAVLFTVSQSIGFASNSYTIWEDSILLFYITSFGLATIASSLRLEKPNERALGVYHSLCFVVLGWIASFSKLCREEQMPYCRSTYYASATSSTSAPWQLLIPFLLSAALPSIIQSYYTSSRSYEGFAPLWIGYAFRFCLFLSAIFWTLDAADDGEWFPNLPSGALKNLRVPIAQTVLAIALGAGTAAFAYAPPCILVRSSATTPENTKAQQTLTILGYANTHGTRYFLLIINILLSIIMVQKPMGGGAIALMGWQILSLLEILDLNSLTTSPIGPVMLALLGSFHFFKTGHQATLSSIQWESAFIPLHAILYPFSPLLVALNSFGAQILAAASVPLIVLWKQKPKKKSILKTVISALAWHIAYYAVISLATTMWAGHLRRHLMLFRIFSPKYMTAALVLCFVDVIGILVTLVAVRFNTIAVGEVFGWG